LADQSLSAVTPHRLARLDPELTAD